MIRTRRMVLLLSRSVARRWPRLVLPVSVAVTTLLLGCVLAGPSAPAAFAGGGECTDATPALDEVVTCVDAGSEQITAPAGAGIVDVVVTGGGGGGANSRGERGRTAVPLS
jgi:hypothetical protein